MKKQLIAVDIDDVLADQKSAVVEFSNYHYGTDLTLDDFKRPGEYWNYWEMIWQVEAEEGNKRLAHFIESDFSKNENPEKGAVSVISRLKDRYELEIITSRIPETTPLTQAWIQRHFPDAFRGIHFTSLWHEDGTATKAEICTAIGAGYLIDDNVEHCLLALEAGLTPLVFGEYGWNMHQKLPSGITRVRSWNEVAEYFGV